LSELCTAATEVTFEAVQLDELSRAVEFASTVEFAKQEQPTIVELAKFVELPKHVAFKLDALVALTKQVELTKDVELTKHVELAEDVELTKHVELAKDVELTKHVELAKHVELTKHVELARAVELTRAVELQIEPDRAEVAFIAAPPQTAVALLAQPRLVALTDTVELDRAPAPPSLPFCNFALALPFLTCQCCLGTLRLLALSLPTCVYSRRAAGSRHVLCGITQYSTVSDGRGCGIVAQEGCAICGPHLRC